MTLEEIISNCRSYKQFLREHWVDIVEYAKKEGIKEEEEIKLFAFQLWEDFWGKYNNE